MTSCLAFGLVRPQTRRARKELGTRIPPDGRSRYRDLFPADVDQGASPSTISARALSLLSCPGYAQALADGTNPGRRFVVFDICRRGLIGEPVTIDELGVKRAAHQLAETTKVAGITGGSRRGAISSGGNMCQHEPGCPEWRALDHLAARIVADQPGQGWSLLWNGVIVFDDGGQLLPDGRAVTPARLRRVGLVAMAA